MGTLVKIKRNIITIKNPSNLLHQNAKLLHYWRKTEDFMENLKIRKYLFFMIFDQKLIKIILNNVRMELFCKNLMETITYV